MHDINDNSTVSNNNGYDYNKCCTTRSEYNDRLISLLNRNNELEDKLQNEQRTNQRYQIKTNVQNILIKELMNNIQSPIDGDICDKNKNNVLLLMKNAKRVAELSMEIEQMKQQQNEKEQQQESLGPNLNYQDGKDVDYNNNGNDQSLSFSSSDKSNNDNDEFVFLLEKERADYFENKCESLERSVNTFKCKNSEREIRNSISLRNMRNQIVSLEKQLKRISIVLQLQENGNDENKNENKNDEKERMNQLEVQNIKLKLKLTEYRRRHEKQLQQQQQQQQHQHQHEREKNYQTSKTSSTHHHDTIFRGMDYTHHDTIFRGMDDDDDEREEANEEVVFLSSSSSSKVHYLSYCDGNTISNNSNSYREEVIVDDALDVQPTQRKSTNNSISCIDTTSNESLESLESSSMIPPLLIALSEDDDDDYDESSSSTFSSSSSSLGLSMCH